MLSAAHLTQRDLRTKGSLALCRERFVFTIRCALLRNENGRFLLNVWYEKRFTNIYDLPAASEYTVQRNQAWQYL